MTDVSHVHGRLIEIIGNLKDEYRKQQKLNEHFWIEQEEECLEKQMEVERAEWKEKLDIVQKERDNIGHLLLESEEKRQVVENEKVKLKEKLKALENELNLVKEVLEEREDQVLEQAKALAHVNEDRRKEFQEIEELKKKADEMKHPLPLEKLTLKEENVTNYPDLPSLLDVMLQNTRVVSKCISQEGLCIICMETKASIAIVPCGHVVTCGKCSPSIKENCPVCRTMIDQKLKLFQ